MGPGIKDPADPLPLGKHQHWLFGQPAEFGKEIGSGRSVDRAVVETGGRGEQKRQRDGEPAIVMRPLTTEWSVKGVTTSWSAPLTRPPRGGNARARRVRPPLAHAAGTRGAVGPAARSPRSRPRRPRTRRSRPRLSCSSSTGSASRCGAPSRREPPLLLLARRSRGAGRPNDG